MTIVMTQTFPIRVRLDGVLARSLPPEAVTAEVTARMGELATTLGISTSPEVTVEDGDAGSARPGMQFWVDDQVLRCSDALFTRAVGSVRDQLPATDRVAEADISDMSTESLAALVGVLCAEIVKRRPSVLATPVTMAAYGEQLADEGFRLDGWQDLLGDVVSGPLTLGISVADTAKFAEALTGTPMHDVVAAQENVISALAPDTMELFVPTDIAAALGTGDPNDPDDLLTFALTGMFEELGIVYPQIVVTTPPWLATGTFAIRLNHVIGMPHALPAADEIVVNDTVEVIGPLVGAVRPVLLPATDRMGSVAPEEAKARLEHAGWTTWDRAGYVVLQLAAAMRTHAAAVIVQDRLLAQLDALESIFPAVVRAARDELPPARLTALVRRLVHGGVPLRHLPSVLERVVDLPLDTLGAQRHLVVEDAVRFDVPRSDPGDDLDAAEAFVRQGLRDHIAQQVSGNTGVVVAYLLGEDIERALAGDMDEPTQDRILAAIAAELDRLPRTATTPVLLTRDRARAALHRLLTLPYPLLKVLAHEDLPADVLVQPIARISLPDGDG